MATLKPDLDLLAKLDEAFPLWTCECKRIYASMTPAALAKSEYRCPVCELYFGRPSIGSYVPRRTKDGRLLHQHCFPPHFDPEHPDVACVVCGKILQDPYPHWQCECRTEIHQYSQEELLENPYVCPTCGHVWDGDDWFKSAEWYEVMNLWWNLSFEADHVLKATKSVRPDTEMESWMLELMDFCDANSNMDALAFYRLAMACYSTTPLSHQDSQKLVQGMDECRPIMELFWHRANSFPGKAESLTIGDENDGTSLGPRTSIRRGRPRSEAVAQRRNLVRQFAEQGMTPGQIDAKLRELKSGGALPVGLGLSVAIVKADLARSPTSSAKNPTATKMLGVVNRLYSEPES